MVYILYYFNKNIRLVYAFEKGCMLSVNVYISLIARGSRTMKTVQLSENEVRALCIQSREIFLNQPILLELGAPLKICGKTILHYTGRLKLVSV